MVRRHAGGATFEVAVGRTRPGRGVTVEVDHVRGARRERPQRLAPHRVDQQHGWRAVGERGAEPLGRVRRIDGEEGGDHVEAAIDADRDQAVRPDPQRPQVMGEPVRAFVERAIGELRRAVRQGDGVGPLPDLRLESLVEAVQRRHLGHRVPVDEQRAALALGQERQCADRPLFIGEHGLEQREPLAADALCGLVIEERRRIAQITGDARGAFVQRQRQVELSGRLRHVQLRELEARHLERRVGGVLPGEHHLKERRVREAARRVHGLDDLVERQVLVSLPSQHPIAGARHELAYRGFAVQVDAQGKGVDEEADQRLDLGPIAARDRAADHDVGLAGQPAQQRRPAGEQQHVGRHAVVLRRRLDPRRQRGVEREVDRGACVILPRGALPVDGQLQEGRRALQTLAPVRRLRLELAVAEPASLPGRVVGVLDREWRQRVGLPGEERAIEPAQLVHEHADRPAVGGDVVHDHVQHVLVLGAPHEQHTQRDFAGEIERAGRVRLDQLDQPACGGLGVAFAAKVLLVEDQPGILDDLHRLAVELLEAGAQCLVPLDDALERAAEDVAGERTAEPDHAADVIGLARAAHLAQEPESPLGQRQRLRPAALRDGDRVLGRARGAADGLGERGELRAQEHVAQRELDPQGLADARDQPHCRERVTAEREEAVAPAHALDLQQLGPDPGERLLDVPRRLLVALTPEVLDVWRRQRLAVEL
ncbi:hypothetical protein BE20_22865, partial [Sorangium cellulosum]